MLSFITTMRQNLAVASEHVSMQMHLSFGFWCICTSLWSS